VDINSHRLACRPLAKGFDDDARVVGACSHRAMSAGVEDCVEIVSATSASASFFRVDKFSPCSGKSVRKRFVGLELTLLFRTIWLALLVRATWSTAPASFSITQGSSKTFFQPETKFSGTCQVGQQRRGEQ